MHLRAQRRRAQLIASDISPARGSTPVLQHVDLAITPVSRVAVVEENGHGKSILLASTLLPDSGTVQRIGTVGVADRPHLHVTAAATIDGEMLV